MPDAPPLCVYCQAEPVSPTYRPFCSDRCKMKDLGRWLNGDYAVPAQPAQTDHFEIDRVAIDLGLTDEGEI